MHHILIALRGCTLQAFLGVWFTGELQPEIFNTTRHLGFWNTRETECEVHYFQKAHQTTRGRWSSSNKKIWEISGSSSLESAAGTASRPENVGLPNIWPRVSKVDAYFARPLSHCCIEPQTGLCEPNSGEVPREFVFKGVRNLGKDTKPLSLQQDLTEIENLPYTSRFSASFPEMVCRPVNPH